MSTELFALRTVAAYRRAIALAIAFSGFLAISFLGVRDLATTALVDAESALSAGAVTGFVAVVYAAAAAGGEVARGGSRWRCSAAAIAAGGPRPARRPRGRGRHPRPGGRRDGGGPDFGLLAAGGGPLPGADALVTRGLGRSSTAR